MAESNDDYFTKVFAESSDEDKKVIEQGDSSFFRELQYGFDKSTFMGADALRLAEAAKGDRTIEEIEAERLSGIDAKFGELSKESKGSLTSFAGELVGEIIDPTILALGPGALAGKAAKLGKIGQRAYSTAFGAGLFGSDAAIELSARGEDVTMGGVALGAIMGGVGGAFLKPVVKAGDELQAGAKAAKPTEDVVSGPQNKITVDEEKAIKEIFTEVDASTPSLIGALSGIPNMGGKIAQATQTRIRYREEYVKAKAKQPGALPKKELDELRLERDKARLFTQSLPDEMLKNSEIISDSLMAATSKLEKAGMLSGSTIGRAITRPIIGAAIGYGAGVTNQLVSEEDTVSPFVFMTAGLLGGQLSKKILKSSYSTNVKEEGLKSLQELNKNSLKAQINLLGSGTTAARLNSLGDDVSAFGKTLLAQRGADLKGAATVSVEEAKDIAIDSLNNTFSQRMMNLGGMGEDSKPLREAAWKYGEKFVDEGDLANQGFNKAQISTIKQISETSRGIVSTVSSEADNVGIKFVKLEDYALPQMHDGKKMADDRDGAIIAYADAFLKQSLATTRNGMLRKNPKADVSKVKASTATIESSQKRATKYVDEIINLGYSGKKVNTWKMNNPNAQVLDFKTRLTPLTDHFEKDRIFTDFEARKSIQDFLVQDVSEIIPNYINSSMPNIEFARAFGSRGDSIFQLKRNIQSEADAAKKAAGGDGKLYKLAEEVRQTKMKAIHNSVEMYFGTYGSQNKLASSEAANSTLSVMTMLGNMTMLSKVTLDSVGDLVQPFINSGFGASFKGKARTNSKELTDFAESTGFAQRDVLSQELRALSLDKNSAASKTQTFTTKANEVFFRTIQLGRLTSYARRFAYNTGIESAFDIAQEVSKKGMTQTVFNKAKALGLSDDNVRVLQKFKTVDEAFDDEAGKNILNIAGVKASDRDALIPQVGNRLGFSQSKDPLIRSLGQFLSWAQAKTTQTNAIVQRIEDGDAALAVRTLGSLAVYDGLISFKQYLNDPTGKYLPDDVDNYAEKTVTREQLGSSIMQAGLSPYYINKMVAIAARPYGSTVSSNISPAFSLIEDYAKLLDQQVGNFEQGDIEGASLQFLRRVPGGKEIEDILAATGNELEDKRKGAKGKSAGSFNYRLGFEKGGEVLDVPNVPTEPDQRIDKMTGQPYDQQAGQAFVDKEDPLRRLGFVGGGDVDPLQRLGFAAAGKVIAKIYESGEELFKKQFSDLTESIDKGTTPKMFETEAEPVTMLTPSKALDIGIDESLADGSKLKNYSVQDVEELDSLLPTASAGTKIADKLIGAKVTEGTKAGVRLNLNSKIEGTSSPSLSKLQTVHQDNYDGKALSYEPYVTLTDVNFSVNQKRRVGIASKIKGLDVPEARNKTPAMSVDGSYTKLRNILKEMDDDVVEIGVNPVGQHLFIDLKTGQAVKGADIATVIGDRVYAKGVTYFKKSEAPSPLAASDGTDIGSTVRYRRNVGGRVLSALKRKQYQQGSEVRSDMQRSDGSTKSTSGYLGPIKNKVSGGTMTEFATNWEDAGIEIPTMVPTLSKKEIKYMQNMKPGQGWNVRENPIDKQIINKAKQHARMRIDKGKSPFYQDGE